MYTAAMLYDELRKDMAFLSEDKRISTEEITLLKSQIEMLKALFSSWSSVMDQDDLQKFIVDILKRPSIENGKVYEALVYKWLGDNFVRYSPQHHIEQNDCFKMSSGYDADGIINDSRIVFDVKQFGLTLPHIETLRRKLQTIIPSEYYLTISGGKNISTRDLQANFLEKARDIAQCLMDEKNKIHTDYIYRAIDYNLEFCAWNRKENPVFTSISEFDLYEWAENNEFYFIYHASQFCINSPYILFCPFDKQLAPIFSSEDDEFAFLSFRALCRRIFINLTKMENRQISDFDGKARKDVSVATAAKKISAIVFIDVSEDFDYQHCRTFVFQNPNADYKIARYQIDAIFRHAGAKIDDFRFDNY